MAKYGEGDKRWIVEDRPDGANVHNWHWAETDCLEWSRTLLTKLLSNQTLPFDQNDDRIISNSEDRTRSDNDKDQEPRQARRRGPCQRSQRQDHPRLRAQPLSLLGRPSQGLRWPDPSLRRWNCSLGISLSLRTSIDKPNILF
ncbi:hypothetical protein CsSME_00015293 [Camellia sinensis var. sinensis]